MAKTIKDMAKEYAKQGNSSYKIAAELDYIEGANAMLEELYVVFNNIFEGVRKGKVTTVNQVINPILERMKELKAE